MEESEISPAAVAEGLASEGERLRRRPASLVDQNLRGKGWECQARWAQWAISTGQESGKLELAYWGVLDVHYCRENVYRFAPFGRYR